MSNENKNISIETKESKQDFKLLEKLKGLTDRQIIESREKYSKNEIDNEEIESPFQLKLEVLAKQISTFGYIGTILIAIACLIHHIVLVGGLANYFKDTIAPTTTQLIGIIVVAVIAFSGYFGLKLHGDKKAFKEDAERKATRKFSDYKPLNKGKTTIISLAISIAVAFLTAMIMCNMAVFKDIMSAFVMMIILQIQLLFLLHW